MLVEQNGFEIRSLGDSALIMQVGNDINEKTHQRIVNIINLMEAEPFEGFIEAVPGYNNITVYYDPITVLFHYKHNENKTSFNFVSDILFDYVNRTKNKAAAKSRLIEIPVIYGDEFGPDLEYVAKYNNITPEKVIELHTEKDYLVYMIGFAPGFPYLAGIHKSIATPRKKKPRPKIPAGSVGIAGEQTGMYPLDSPGGWQIIGQTPIDLFTPESSTPTLLQSGDQVRFIPITKDEYLAYKEKNYERQNS